MPYRVAVDGIYRKKSPFEGLLQHMSKVKECVALLKEGVLRYIDGE